MEFVDYLAVLYLARAAHASARAKCHNHSSFYLADSLSTKFKFVVWWSVVSSSGQWSVVKSLFTLFQTKNLTWETCN